MYLYSCDVFNAQVDSPRVSMLFNHRYLVSVRNYQDENPYASADGIPAGTIGESFGDVISC